MQNASGAISAREIGILAMSASGIRRSKTGGSTRRWANATIAMPPTATLIGEIPAATCHAVRRRSSAAAAPLPSPGEDEKLAQHHGSGVEPLMALKNFLILRRAAQRLSRRTCNTDPAHR